MQKLCPFCHFPIIETFFFCPNCGKKLKEVPPATTIAKQIGIYALSVFLPPLGLWPGIKYLMQPDQKAKTIGMVAIVLTLVSTLVTVWIALSMVNQINQTFNFQLQQQGLGF